MLAQNHEINNDDQDLKKINYKKIHNSKTILGFYSFAFNSDSTVLFVGCAQGKIKIYQFNNSLKQIQSLRTLDDYKLLIRHEWKYEIIWHIFYMKKSKQLATSQDKIIIIWKPQGNNFSIEQQWQAHKEFVDCLIINDDEDMLISGSIDDKIKFWKQKHKRWICSQSIDAKGWIVGLSLNFSSTKLIAIGVFSENIFIIVLQPNQQWLITQIIKVKTGFRLGFINDNAFAFKPIETQYLEIFNYDQKQKQFIQDKQVKLFTKNCSSSKAN